MSWIFSVDGNYVNFNGGANLYRLHKDSNCIAWHFDETGDLFFDVYDQQYSVKAENIGTVIIDGVPLSAASDFGDAIIAVFPGLGGGSPGGSSYLVYTAFLMQTGTDTITSVVLENTMDVPLEFSNFGTGAYLLSGFGRTLYQIAIPPFGNFQGNSALYLPLHNGSSQVGWYSYFYDPDSFGGCIDIGVVNISGVPTNLSDLIGDTGAIFMEVRAYP